MTSALVEESLNGNVLHLLLNRPEKKNALTHEMYEAMVAVVSRARTDAAVKVLLISGAGGAFTAGADLEDFVQRPPQEANAPVFEFMRGIAEMQKPVVAAVEGLAIGLGTTMLHHCDLVYAAANAKFALPFVKLGLAPEAASSLLLPRLVGRHRAAEMLLLGDPFSAQEACELGMVNKVLEGGAVLAHALAQAQRLASLPSGSIAATKKLMYGPETRDEVLARIELEVSCFIPRLTGPAAKEAFAAFREKRSPNFSDIE